MACTCSTASSDGKYLTARLQDRKIRLVSGSIALGQGCVAEGFDIKFFIVGVSGDFIDIKTLDERDAHPDVRFLVAGQPNFIIDVGLLEDEAGAFVKRGQQAASHFKIVREIRFETHYIMCLLVDPNNSDKLLQKSFAEIAGLVVWITLKVKYENILSTKTLVPWIDKLASTQDRRDPDVITLFPFVFGFVALGLLLSPATAPTLNFLNMLLHPLIFFLLLVFIQRVVVLLDQRADFASLEVKDLIFVDFPLF